MVVQCFRVPTRMGRELTLSVVFRPPCGPWSGRPALALWIGGLDLRDFREGGSPGAPSGDKRMLDLIGLSMRSGWTPKEVLMWLFPSFGGLLFDLSKDEAGSA